MYHIPEDLARLLINCNCFAMERMHGVVKTVARHAPGNGREKYVLKRQLHEIFKSISSWNLEEVYFGGRSKAAPELFSVIDAAAVPGVDVESIRTSEQLTCRLGSIMSNELVCAVDSKGSHRICKIIKFVMCSSYLSSASEYLVLLEPLASYDQAAVKSCGRDYVLSFASSIEAVLTHASIAGGVLHPWIPYFVRHGCSV
jgi:hypothetical protein